MLSSGKKSPVKLQRNNKNIFLLLLEQHLITFSKKLTWNSLHQELSIIISVTNPLLLLILNFLFYFLVTFLGKVCFHQHILVFLMFKLKCVNKKE